MSDTPPVVEATHEEDPRARRLLGLLNDELRAVYIEAEFYFVGGAVMVQAFRSAPSTAHVSQLFESTSEVTAAADRVQEREGLPAGWLTGSVLEVVGPDAPAGAFVEMSNLRALVPPPQYVLAVKCAAMRLGTDLGGLDDLRYVLRALNVTAVTEALEIVTRYFSDRQLAPDTTTTLEGLLAT